MPVPETNGEEWDRLEPASALDVLVELALHGEYNGLESGKRIKEGLELRTAAVGVFEVITVRLFSTCFQNIYSIHRISYAKMRPSKALLRS